MALRRRRLLGFLRSRRLAVWLIAGLSAYSILTTAIPQSPFASAEKIAQWQAVHPLVGSVTALLSLHRAYWSPLFIVPAALLAFSTALCAWERTRAALVFRQLESGVPARMHNRLVSNPSFSIETDGVSPDASARAIRTALESTGLGVSEVSGVLLGRSRTWAAIGSALFHWALVGLFVVAGVGQATKWEGQIGIPVGHSVIDETDSYGLIVRGPLSTQAPSTGYEIAVPTMELDLEDGGIERGHAPRVELRQGGSVVAQGLVYPNSPLVSEGLYIHRSEWGLGMVAALETTSGEEVGRRNFLFEFQSAKRGRITIESGMPPELGVDRIAFALPLDRAASGKGHVGDLPRDPRIEVGVPAGAEVTSTVLRAGDVIAFPGGQLRLRIVDVTRYARLFIVHDPSIPIVYAFLVLAMLGGAVAVLVHPRAVLATVAGDGGRIDVLVLAKRIDPMFSERVRRALELHSSGGGP